MKKTICILLSLLFVLFSFVGCSKEQIKRPNVNADYLSEIMKSSDKYPQLTKVEFINITKNYLSSNKWDIPAEKACFSTYGVNYSAYIVEKEFLFSIYTKNDPDGSMTYDVCLSYYLNGKVDKTEADPTLFEDFLN